MICPLDFYVCLSFKRRGEGQIVLKLEKTNGLDVRDLKWRGTSSPEVLDLT